jgi:lactobin A/cerein 7B family class IIb bacteriocin
MNEEQIKEIFSDEAFTSSLLELETAEEVQSALSGKGLDLSLDEITNIRSYILATAEQGGELAEEQLETVTGGIALVAIGIIIGVAIGSPLGLFTAMGKLRW